MATIELRQGGTFRARVRRDGATQLSRTFDIRHDAERWATETEAAIRGGRLREQPANLQEEGLTEGQRR